MMKNKEKNMDMHTFVKIWFGFVAVMVMSVFIFIAVTIGSCVISGDRDSMACWMMTERVDMTVRHR